MEYNLSIDNLLGERWQRLFINDIETIYFVSDFGRLKSIGVRNIHKINSEHFWHPKIVKRRVNNGYHSCALSLNKEKIYKQMHQLVATYFVPNPDGRPQINHKDGNRLNNYYKNLEWSTQEENVLHSYFILGKQFYKQKPIAQMDKDGHVIKIFNSINDIQRQMNLKSNFGIWSVLNDGKSQKIAYGFKWKYA